MRSRQLLLPVLFLFSISLQAQIRDFVPIVRSKYHDETVAFLQRLGESMEHDGYYNAAEALERYAAGGFGSGFVYVGKDGSNYVVTNLHVVAQAASVTLEFQQRDGGKTLYENCTVLAVDEELDLALIAFPAGSKPFKQGLSLSAENRDDGAEVWSAGYPGLGDTPSWQLGKGNITNAAARIPELADPEVTHVIQHSAPVDPGNSGGPLLVSDRGSPSGYAVIGINTWKALSRQAANFSIPAGTIGVFLERALGLGKPRMSRKAQLEKRCLDFTRTAARKTEAYEDLAPYISYAYVGTAGEGVLKDVLSTAPSKVWDTIMGVFTESSPIEGVRLAIAYAILSKIPEAETSALSFQAVNGDAEGDDAPVPVVFLLDGNEIATAWVREQGIWRLAEYPGIGKSEEEEKTGSSKKKKDAGSAVSFDSCPYYTLLSLGALMHSGENLKIWLFAADFADNFYSLGLELGFGGLSFDDPFDDSLGAVGQIAGNLKGQIPITFGSFALIPYGGAEIGVLALLDQIMISPFLSAEGGVRIGIGSFYLGAAYRYYFMAPEIFPKTAVYIFGGLGV